MTHGRSDEIPDLRAVCPSCNYLGTSGQGDPEGRNWPLDRAWTNNNAQEYISKQNRQEKVKTVHAPITVAKRKISNYTQRSLSLQLPTNEKLESFQV